MREGTRNFLVGAATIVAAIGLAALLMLFGEFNFIADFAHPRYKMTVRLNDAAGLGEGSLVTLNGYQVGLVKSVELIQHPQYPIEVIVLIDEDVQIPTSVEPDIESALIGGNAALVLELPTPPLDEMDYFDPESDIVIKGIHQTLPELVQDELDKRMQPIIAALEDFKTLSQTYTELGNNLNELVLPQTDKALAAGETPNLRTAANKINKSLDDISAAVTLAREWLEDDQLRADAKAAVTNARLLVEQATDAVEQFAAVAESLETDSDRLVNRFLPVIDQLAVTLEDIQQLTREAKSGRGTIPQLISNPDLYNSLNDAAMRLEQTLIEAQLLIQKLKAEGVRVGL